MSYANTKGADQPAHPRSLISAFVVRCLDNVMSQVSLTKISSLMQASVAEQASLSLTWLKTLEDIFSHDEAQIKLVFCSFIVLFRNTVLAKWENKCQLKVYCYASVVFKCQYVYVLNKPDRYIKTMLSILYALSIYSEEASAWSST